MDKKEKRLKRFQMPTADELLRNQINTKKAEPEWLYLERKINESKGKPKPEVVDWIKEIKKIRLGRERKNRRTVVRLREQTGPPWYCEFTSNQKNVLRNLKNNIHEDLLEGIPVRIRRALSDLGITVTFKKSMLMKLMTQSLGDPGLFMWYLYEKHFGHLPNEIQDDYDSDAQLIMSSLVFIDYDDFIEELNKIIEDAPKKPPPPKKKPVINEIPNVKCGPYLQKFVACQETVGRDYSSRKRFTKKTLHLDNRLYNIDPAVFEKLLLNTDFLNKRRQVCHEQKIEKRVCNYPFWEAPAMSKSTDPKEVEQILKMKMFRLKAKTRFVKHKPPYENYQVNVGTVTYVTNRPVFLITGMVVKTSGYVPLHLGYVMVGTDCKVNNGGYWKYPRDDQQSCDPSCTCAQNWDKVQKHLEKTKCKCGHYYDFNNKGKVNEIYFNKPTRHAPFWIDHAKVYQLDSKEEFIKKEVMEALRSDSTSSSSLHYSISASQMPNKVILQGILAHLADTHLLTPHLPQANLLVKHQEWIHKRIKGPRTKEQNLQLKLRSQRQWVNLDHLDFKARVKRILFTEQQHTNMNLKHKKTIMEVANRIKDEFITKTRLKQLQQTRLLWGSMRWDAYYSKNIKFEDAYFSYMPGRFKDTYVINPYDSATAPKRPHIACPLN